MALFSFIGVNVIGDISDQFPMDTYIIDYSDFFKLLNLLYMLSIADFYPDM